MLMACGVTPTFQQAPLRSAHCINGFLKRGAGAGFFVDHVLLRSCVINTMLIHDVD
jgi:hypothetical protein